MTLRPVLLSLLLALLVGLPQTAPAQSSIEDVFEAKVLPGWRMADGTHMAAIEITLDPGWKTYWRAPGDLGIPPRFDWRSSKNLAGVEIIWPTPSPIHQDGMISIGYADQVVFPLKVLPKRTGRAIRLGGALELGVCREVCIPVHLTLAATLDPGPAARDPRIAAALADQPYSQSEARVRAVQCRISRAEEGLHLTAELQMPSAGGREVAVFETGNPHVWVAPAKTRRSGNTLHAQTRLVHVEGQSFAVNRSELRITVLGQSYAVDIQGCPAG